MQEKSLADFKREFENIKRAQECRRIRDRQIYTEPNKTIVQIEKFQRENQQQINELHVVIPTSANHIYLWENTDPKEKTIQTCSSMTNDVLLSEKQMARLQTGIIELKQNILHINNNFKSLQREKARLIKDRIIKEDLNECRGEKCNG